MKPLDKMLTLREAAKISGYHQDYLGSLIRKGELKGKKVGRSYFTTEEALNEYIFARKITKKEWAFGHFFSQGRIKKIIVVSFFLLLGSFFYFLQSSERNYQATETPNTTLDLEPEFLADKNERK